jgi:hypothetical protein
LLNSTGWIHWRNYFPVSLKTPPKDQFPLDRNYIFAIHPHGLYSFGAFANFVAGGEQAPFALQLPQIDLRLATLKFNFLCPLWREVNLSYGFIAVDFKTCLNWLSFNAFRATVLSTKPVQQRSTLNQLISINPFYTMLYSHRAITSTTASQSAAATSARVSKPSRGLLLVVGGAEEALCLSTNQVNLVLTKRKGFIKLALVSGASLVPCFSFGETLIYSHDVPNPNSWVARGQVYLKRALGWTIPMCRGRFGIWVPFRRPIVTVSM